MEGRIRPRPNTISVPRSLLFYSISTKKAWDCVMKNDLELVSSRIFVLFVNFLLCVGDEGGVCVRMLSKFLLRTEKLPSFSCGGYITRVCFLVQLWKKGDDLERVRVGGCISAVYKRRSRWIFMPKHFYERRPSATLNETCKSKQLPLPSSAAAVNFFFSGWL